MTCCFKSVVLAIAATAVASSGSSLAQCPPTWEALPGFTVDADIAVGRQHVLIADHDHVRLFNKCAAPVAFLSPPGPTTPPTLLPNGLPLNGTESNYDSLFYNADPNGTYTHGNGNNILGDERLWHDPLTNRFFVVASGLEGNQGAFVAISQVNDARTWTTITRVPIDVPCMPINASPLHVASISVDATSVWFMGEIQGLDTCMNQLSFVIGKFDKGSLITLGSDTQPHWWQEPTPAFVAYQPRIAKRHTFDSAPQYALGIDPFSPSTLFFLAMRTNSLGQILAPHEQSLPVAPWASKPTSYPQGLAGTPIGGGADVGIWTPIYRDGYLWAVHCVGNGGTPNRSVVRWYKIKMNNWNGPGTSLPMVEEWGELDPGADWNCYLPSIAVHANGQAAVVYNASPLIEQEFISIFTHTRCGNDSFFGPAARQYTHTVKIVAPILGSPDYGGVAPDPLVPGRSWFHQGLVRDFVTKSIAGRVDSGCGLDYTGDGEADGDDAAAFGSLFLQAAPDADLEPDGTIDTADAMEYQAIGQP